jgi:hypothetical protein
MNEAFNPRDAYRRSEHPSKSSARARRGDRWETEIKKLNDVLTSLAVQAERPTACSTRSPARFACVPE